MSASEYSWELLTRLCSQNGKSEEWIGEWMEARGNREQLVLATKVSQNFRLWDAVQEIIFDWLAVYEQLR